MEMIEDLFKHKKIDRLKIMLERHPECTLEFLRRFWNSEGRVVWNCQVNEAGGKNVIRQLEASNSDEEFLGYLVELHKNLGIEAKFMDGKIVISGKDNLQRFSRLINFSPEVEVVEEEFFSGFKKRDLLQWMIESFESDRRVYVESFGCSTNLADGEAVAGCLSRVCYSLTDKAEDADILIYNTCAVKTPTENRMISILEKAPEGKKIIVTGCLPLINFNRLKARVKFDGVLGPAPGSRIVEAVCRVERGEKVVMLKNDFKPSCNLPRVFINRIIGIVPICYGCTGECSYCCVRFARGRLRSYRIDEIVSRVKRDLALGVKEIWLTAQDTASYGRDIEANLADLLREVCEVDGKFFIRVGMMTPNYALEILDDLIKAYENEKVFKFLHLPVQSGDNRVLKLMNRRYSVEDFKKVIHSFRERIPKITVATDILCGFPGEDEQAFTRTISLIKEVMPDIVNVAKFSPRPETPAAKMKQLPSSEIKDRSRKTATLVREIALDKNREWVGWAGEILIDERGKGSSWIGRNFAYKPIVVRGENDLLGKRLQIRVRSAFTTHLEADTID
jgi:MiaB-like tRNA modifying enzyme